MKNLIRKIVLRLFPELACGLHLPQLAVVTAIPDPPKNGETFDEVRPRYAVDVRLLLPNGEIDEDMPLIRDVPVALAMAAADRGFAGLPQPGTVVEIAFAFGQQTRPFIRTALPYNLKLPGVSATSMRWQQSATSFQEVDGEGNWTRTTGKQIADIADKIWIGDNDNNALRLDSQFMQAVITTLEALATHTHPEVDKCSQGAQVSSGADAIKELKTALDKFAK